MSLLNRSTEFAPDTASGPAAAEAPWEGEAKTVATAPAPAAAAPVAAPVPAQVPAVVAAAPVPALAAATSRALSAVNKMNSTAIIKALKDAVRVNWDTLDRLKANQGAFKYENTNLGPVLDVELMSWQEVWQASPGGDNNATTKKLVRYSDDGRTINGTNEDIKDYTAGLVQAGYSKAKLSMRVVLVFSVLESTPDPRGKAAAGQLFQLSLAPTSVSKFTAHSIRQAMNLAQGSIKEETAHCMRLTVDSAKNGDNDYAVVKFEYVK